MTVTYEAIQSTTLGSNQTSVELTTISQAYTDLICVINSISTASSGIYMRVGDATVDSGTNYSYTYMYGNGSSASSGRTPNDTVIYCGDQSSTVPQTTIIQLNNYSNTTTNKTSLSRAA